MAKYQITHSCGHTETVALFGKSKDRDWQIEKLEGKICPECWHEQQIEADKKAAEQNAVSGLPELTGSEKQILWAEKIRADKLALLETLPTMPVYEMDTWWSWHHLRDFISKEQEKEISGQCENKGDLFKVAIQLPILQKGLTVLKAQTRASWWIDNRDSKLSIIIAELLKALPAEQPSENKPLEIDAQAEATVRPETPVTETVAEIKALANKITVSFPEKVESFRLIMRNHGFTWSGSCWVCELNARNGVPSDRAAEIGHILLGSGFIIRIYDDLTRQLAIDGNYSEEQTRWITAYTSGNEQGRLCISWSRDEDYDKAAKRLPTAYVKPSISVAVEQFEQVLDFAEINDFSISETAMKVIDAAREAKEHALIAHVELVDKVQHSDDGKPVKLETPENVGVDNDLRD
ncbi:MAG: hypothetical protein WC856_13800 [Methylococcaceae bacterium]|jgi:hypothetical protein